MGALSPILRSLEGGKVAFWCPGCDKAHAIPVDGKGKSNWTYNNDPQRPTFSPSILVRSGHYLPRWDAETCYCHPRPDGTAWGFKCGVCHSFVKDGQIQFLNDCTHHLAGRTVPIPPFDQEPI